MGAVVGDLGVEPIVDRHYEFRIRCGVPDLTSEFDLRIFDQDSIRTVDEGVKTAISSPWIRAVTGLSRIALMNLLRYLMRWTHHIVLHPTRAVTNVEGECFGSPDLSLWA